MGHIILYCGIGLLGVVLIMLITFAFRKLKYDASRAAEVDDEDLSVTIPGSDEIVKLEHQPKPVIVTPSGIVYGDYEDGEQDDNKAAKNSEKLRKTRPYSENKDELKPVENPEMQQVAEGLVQEDTADTESGQETDVTENTAEVVEDEAEALDAGRPEPECNSTEKVVDISDGTHPDITGEDDVESMIPVESAAEIDVQKELEIVETEADSNKLLLNNDDTNGSLDSEFEEGVVSE